jgi:hypothetical protein
VVLLLTAVASRCRWLSKNGNGDYFPGPEAVVFAACQESCSVFLATGTRGMNDLSAVHKRGLIEALPAISRWKTLRPLHLVTV